MKILAVSDVVVDWIYTPKVRLVLSDTELAVGCGDLPTYYLEFIVSSLDIPLFYVHGNHSIVDASVWGDERGFGGMQNLHCSFERYKGVTFAGVEGSVRYNEGNFQYSQFMMWLNVFRLVPALLMNRLNSDHFLHVFVSHAPPWGIHDQSDLSHHGVKAFRWLLIHFHPEYHLHGHIHVYRPDMETETIFCRTRVINPFGYRKIDLGFGLL